MKIYLQDMDFEDYMKIFELYKKKSERFAIFDEFNQEIRIPDRRGFIVAKIFYKDEQLFCFTESKPLTHTEIAKSKLFLMKHRLEGHKELMKEKSKLRQKEEDGN